MAYQNKTETIEGETFDHFRKKANKINSTELCAEAYCNKVKPYFDSIRYHCDKLELLVDDELWPLSKYREMIMLK